MIPNATKAPFDAWTEAVGLVHRWLEKAQRLDELMECVSPSAMGIERARVQHLVYGVVRHHLRLKACLEARVSHAPRFRVQAILYVASYELIEGVAQEDASAQTAKVVHHAVERAKRLVAQAEVRLINAVLRRVAADLALSQPPPALAAASVLASYFSHPEWMVRRWLAQFGAAPTRSLLEWNQRPALVYARWRGAAEAVPAWLEASKWPGYYLVVSGHWKEAESAIQAGQLYVQDPSTRLSVELLAPKEGEAVLDLCAAPGGKSVHIADLLKRGRLVAVDLPTPRLDRLRQNLGRLSGVESHLVKADILRDLTRKLAEEKLPEQYAAVLLDAPCSNTGVIAHRVDVKERLREDDLLKHPRQQLQLLEAAARHVAPGGRLVYSTCSIDPDENEGVVRAFLSKVGSAFSLEKTVLSFPWVTGHDGAAAFLIQRA